MLSTPKSAFPLLAGVLSLYIYAAETTELSTVVVLATHPETSLTDVTTSVEGISEDEIGQKGGNPFGQVLVMMTSQCCSPPVTTGDCA